MEDREYLGDAVYASYDGYQVRLETPQGMVIFLDDQVLSALNDYHKRVTTPHAAEPGAERSE